MKKFLLAATVASGALLLSWDGVTLTVSDAQARIGRPGTYFSVAGVHRRAMRRTYGVGWRYGGVRPYRYSYRRVWHHPVAARAALYPGINPGWGGCNAWNCGGWGAPGVGGWGSGFGWRPGFGFGAPGFGWHRVWGW